MEKKLKKMLKKIELELEESKLRKQIEEEEKEHLWKVTSYSDSLFQVK